MTVTTEELGSARVIRWDNQRHRNAWGGATIAAIADALDAAASDPAVRCLVARGAGEDFSAGDDLFEAAEADAASFAATIDEFQRLTRVVLASPVPVIAAIDGVCIGGALEFAASCDLRIGTERARFATPEVRIGLGAATPARCCCPRCWARAPRASCCSPARSRTPPGWTATASSTRSCPPTASTPPSPSSPPHSTRPPPPAVARTKRMLNDRFGDLLPAAMERETLTCVELFDTPEAQEAVQRFARRS